MTGSIGNERAPNAPEPESQSPGEDANLFPKLLPAGVSLKLVAVLD